MALLNVAALGVVGYIAYRCYGSSKVASHPAFASGQHFGDNFSKVRDSGPHAMADTPAREWSREDEESDQSFPASDPLSNY